ncbi:hypothetical protein BKA69DRAFT_1060773 [Paraphysoderma sedebokerense]|nr:hypothetical protein BKA69DRAFT_1060773 [Paraphysoderma sedebokerense]
MTRICLLVVTYPLSFRCHSFMTHQRLCPLVGCFRDSGRTLEGDSNLCLPVASEENLEKVQNYDTFDYLRNNKYT